MVVKMVDNKLNSKSLVLFSLTLTFLIFLSTIISAAEIQFVKSDNSTSFASGETLIAKISGNFVQNPTAANVFFYRNHVRIPVDYNVGFMNDYFYVYAQLSGKVQGNYSLALEGVSYFVGIEESDADLVSNFTITNQTADFTVFPGFIDSANASTFEINVQNLKAGQITVSVDADGFSNPSSVLVKSGEIKTISFTKENPDDLSKITLSSPSTKYTVPVFSSNSTTSGTTVEFKERSLRFEPDSVSISVPTNSESKRIVYLLNTGEEDIEDIEFFVPVELEDYVTIVSSSDISINSTEKVQIIINSNDKELSLNGRIIAKAENVSTSLKLIVNFIDDYVPANNSDSDSSDGVVLTTCSGLNGKFCAPTEKCSEDIVPVADGNGLCCLKTCEVVKKSSSGKILGWSLLAIVVLLLLWFFKRYKRVRPSVDLLNMGKR